MRIRFLGQHVHGSIAALALTEALIFAGALILAAPLRFQHGLAEIQSHEGALWPRAILFCAANLLTLFALGLYSARQRAGIAGIFLRVVVGIFIGTGVTAMLLYLLPYFWIGRSVLAYAAGLSLVGIVASRAFFARVANEDIFKRSVLVYGCGRRAGTITELRRRSDRRGFRLIGFVQAQGERCTVDPALLLQPAENLLMLCERHEVDEVVVAMDDRRRAFPIKELLDCRLAGIEVTELLTFLERETGRVRIDALNPSWMIFGEGFKRGPVRQFCSRALDLTVSIGLVIVSLPLMLATVIAIKLEDGWRAPVLYRQTRVGLAGRPFSLLKFRSMRIDAERDGRAQWAQKSDPRVTRIGGIIRKLRIDELPQILNVLRGHMSVVGPRPERPQFVEELAQKIPYYLQRHCVKPGITGWAQLCYPYGSSDQDALEKLQYDLYYIKNNNLLFDLAILVQTAEVVLMGKGAR